MTGYKKEEDQLSLSTYQAEANYRKYIDCPNCGINFMFKEKDNTPGCRMSDYYPCPKCGEKYNKYNVK